MWGSIQLVDSHSGGSRIRTIDTSAEVFHSLWCRGKEVEGWLEVGEGGGGGVNFQA